MRLNQFASITKKMAIAAFGAFLLLFLPVHLGINLCLLRDDGGHWFRLASHFMGTNYIVKVFEIVLIGSVLLHIIIGILLTIQNLLARPVRYKVSHKSKTHFMSRYMIYTGGLVGVFLIIHFVNFYFVKINLVEGKYTAKLEQVQKAFGEKLNRLQAHEIDEAEQEVLMAQYHALTNVPQEKIDKYHVNLINLTKDEVEVYCGKDYKAQPDFYAMSKDLFSNKYYSLIYILSFIILGLHLMHAINSLAQTFGLSHKKYNSTIEFVAIAYAIIVPLGFALIPIIIYYFS